MELPASRSYASRKSEDLRKKAERDLKIKYFKKKEKIRATMHMNSSHSPKWPSLSTINADMLPPLQNSRNSAEIVCKKSLLKSALQNQNGCNRFATFSVKDSLVFSAEDIDKKVMHPPSNTVVQHAKSSATVPAKADVEHKCNSLKKEQSDIGYEGKQRSVTFLNWTVQIYEDNLIVKGRIEGESRIVRSKPILKRLESNKILSIKSSIYFLDGTLTDFNKSLPDFIFNKFLNGFPVDWLNVAEVWKTYVQQGSPTNFSWPKDIADHDNELLSQVTDFYCNTNPKNSTIHPSTSSGYASYSQIPDKSNPEESNEENKIFNIKNDKGSTLSNSVEPFSKNNTSYLQRFIKDDKVSAILGYLKSKNCTAEFEDKFVDLLCILRYMSTVEFDSCEPKVKKFKLSENVKQEVSSPEENKKGSDKSMDDNSEDENLVNFHSTSKIKTHTSYSDRGTTPIKSTSKSNNKPIVKSVEKISDKSIVIFKSKSNTSKIKANKPEDDSVRVDSAKKIDTYKEVQNSPSKKDAMASDKNLLFPPIVKLEKIEVKSFKVQNIHESRNSSLVLSSWYPNLIYLDSGQTKKCLVFEGSLLGESQRVIEDKFCSSEIKMRHSENLLETMDDEMIELVGNCMDTTEIFSKELSEFIMEHCQNGCPEDLDEFCRNWLILEQTASKSNISITELNSPKSSRGRTYWEGERLQDTTNDVQYFRERFHNRVCNSTENNNSDRRVTRLGKKRLELEAKQKKLDGEIDDNDDVFSSNENSRNLVVQNRKYNTRSKTKLKNMRAKSKKWN